MSYDHWKATAPESDDCTEDAETCLCPECVAWRDNREPSDASRDWVSETIDQVFMRMEVARRLKR